MKRNDKDEVTSKADDPVVEQAGDIAPLFS